MTDKTLYTEDSIESLSPREHVRLRSGMYIGSTEDPTQLIIELFSNALDEHNLGHGDIITIGIKGIDKTKPPIIVVEDEGQGFPIDSWREDGETVLQAAFDVMNTSGKYSEDGVYGGTSLGLNGVGAKATCFLASKMEVVSTQKGKSESLVFKDGILESREVFNSKFKTGTCISFVPDPQFFERPYPDINRLRKIFDDICGLCPKLTIILNTSYIGKDDNSAEKIESFSHPKGIVELVEQENSNPLINSIYSFQEKEDKYTLDCGLTYSDNNSSKIIAYVNYGLTEQGPHITAIKSCITKVMNKWAREQNILKDKDKNLDGDSLQEGLILVFNLIAPNISYDAQTKSRIVNKDFGTSLNEIVAKHLEIWLDNNPDDGKKIIEKALLARRAAEAAKKAREAVRQKAEKKDKVFKLPTTLVDAWTKDRTKAELMKNQEVNNLILALGLDINTKSNKLIYDKSKLRYNKIIACTDADPAGAAIENLLFNILWYLCPELIINGHIYSSIPPLFRVTTKKNEYIYLRDEKALKQYQLDNERKIQSIGRLKGLGEMDSEELEYTLLNPKTRNIIQLSVNDIDKTEDRFEMLYGKAVKPRVDFILKHSEEVEVDFE